MNDLANSNMTQNSQPVRIDFNTPELQRKRRMRALKDRLTRWYVLVGGLAVLAAITLIFFYLAYVVLPLFQGAHLSSKQALAPAWLQQDAGKPLRYKPKLRYALGDPRLQPSIHRYPLPWRGGPFRQTQCANGTYSHFTPKGRYAVDIAMPEGTPIVAARGGVVVKTENQQSGRGNNPAGNFVRILHDDGTMGVYLHLMKGSVGVREGQRVETGSLLARSGNTGNSTGPHLHFVVQRNVGLAVESIPFNFRQPVNSLPNFAVGGE